jgi:steroid 5-alpha reductase family enzyme
MLNTIIGTSLAVWVYVSIWFIVSIIIKRNDVADIAWGPGFIVVAGVALIINHNYVFSSILVSLLITIWGVRLATHIGARNIKKSEDSRYKIWRDSWGKWFIPRSYLQVFILQGLLMLVISAPVLLIIHYSSSGTMPLILLGLFIWTFGFMFEASADQQLAKFLKTKNKKHEIMDSGLWRYSRHPNYFGELVQWLAIGICALSVSYGYIGLIGPAVISFLIIRVSGIPMLEKKHLDDKDYIAYRSRTSILIPKRPRQG